MRRVLAIFAALASIVAFQFAFYPGHGFLSGDTESLVPQLQHLAAPGFLSRDLPATHPSLTLTVYDEVTLSLRRVMPDLDLDMALTVQQIAFRLAALLGVFLMARAAGLGNRWSLLTAALVNLIGTLPGPAAAVVELEPVPRAFAFGLVLLAAGLFAHGKPMLAGLSAGAALVYDARIAAPFWLVLLLAMIFDKRVRAPIRSTITILVIFILLLANLAQLQPVSGDPQALFDRLPPAIEAVQRFRLPGLFVSTWEPREFLLYLCVWLLDLWALSTIWKGLNAALRWILAGLPALGLLGLPAAYALLQILHCRVGPELQPARTLIFTAALTSVACCLAARLNSARTRWFFLAGPVLLLIATYAPAKTPLSTQHPTAALADWAAANTWGASMFLFPDSGKSSAPGRFRARATRAVWVDWDSGNLCAYSDSFAREWMSRWRDTMEGDYSLERLRGMLKLPVDYYVLPPGDAIPNATPVFSSTQWRVYDAHDLRTLLRPLRAVAAGSKNSSWRAFGLLPNETNVNPVSVLFRKPRLKPLNP